MVKINGISIHSSYAPEKEAERFILQQDIKPGKYLFIIIGAGQGFLARNLVRIYPGSKAISFYLNNELFFAAGSPENSWFPGSSLSLLQFLHTEIEDLLIPLLNLIQWDPCRKAFPNNFNMVLSTIHRYINERNASIVTTVNFGKTWFRNVFFNMLLAERMVILHKTDKPVVITAAGPTLSSTLPALSAHRKNFFLLALPSSLLALQTSGIIPDLIVNTDPGFWNTYHFMRYPHKNVPIAMPLTGSIFKGENPVLLLNQRTILEKSFCKTYTIPAVELPPHGTVAGTALFLALEISSAPIIFSGLDLSYKDIHEHVKPHIFQALIEMSQNRFNPLLSLLFKRKFDRVANTAVKDQDRAFRTYETWFTQTTIQRKIYRLNPSSIKLSPFIPLDTETFARIVPAYKKNNNQFTSSHLSLNSRKSMIQTILKGFIKDIHNKKQEITDFQSLDSFIYFLKSDPFIYEIIELTEFQNILKAIKKIAGNNTLKKKEVTDIFSRIEQYIGFFHV